MATGHHGHAPDAAWSVADAIQFLESPERRRALDPEAVLELAGVTEGDRLADVGAGSGFFALPASRRVGPTGQVYAIDVSPEMVDWLRARVDREGAANVTVVRALPGRIPLPERSVDVVLLSIVLHDLSAESLRESIRLLAPGGRLINLDWRKLAGVPGPPLPVRLSPTEARRRLSSLGLDFVRGRLFGPWHYLQVFRRPSSAVPGRSPRPRRGTRR